MFYPFNAPMARKETADAKLILENEDQTLLQAYLTITHVYIQRAARGGHTKTAVYCPYYIREDFCKTLRESGFIISATTMPNKFWISWEEV